VKDRESTIDLTGRSISESPGVSGPALVALTGPRSGARLPLDQGELLVGRDADAGIVLSDPAVSRHHARVSREDGTWAVVDLDSLNGTFVNGVPVRHRELRSGDRIEIGATVFVFQEEGVAPSSTAVELSEETLRLGSALVVSAREAATEPRAPGRELSAERLAAANREIAGARSVPELARVVLDAAFDVTPARRGAVFVSEESGEELAPVLGVDRLKGPGAAVTVSRRVLTRVAQTGEGLLCNDVLAEEALAGAGSLVSSGTRALLAAAFAARGRTNGAVFLDATEPSVRFDEAQLRFLLALGAAASLALENLRHVAWLEDERKRLEAELPAGHEMVGESPRIQEVLRLLARIAPTDSSVLLLGESGTGKEMAARAIHRAGPRSGRAFVAINGASLGENLLESDLFGHERGAFTGAVVAKAGRLELADGGTLFLDEVGELPPGVQAKLLRVLETREFERVGGTRTRKADLRIVAATNRDLKDDVRAGRFREDLFYRLNVVSVTLPPLRERREDIPLLASYFAARVARRLNRKLVGIAPETHALLRRHDWPGNVRELANAIERAVLMTDGEVVRPESLPEEILDAGVASGSRAARFHETVLAAKRSAVLGAMKESGGNVTEAARLLGLHPNYLHRLLRVLRLRGDERA
jgi:transcriptional regulator with GAF, ATPase, and Fis domain